MEVVRNINLVVSSSSPQEILTAFSKFPEVEVVQFKDKSNALYSLTSGVGIHLQIASDRTFPFSLYQLTGNLDHWNGMVKKAASMDLELTDQGLRRNNKIVSCKEEEGIFDALGLDVIPPELREGQGEIEAAESRTLPHLVEGKDIGESSMSILLTATERSPSKPWPRRQRKWGSPIWVFQTTASLPAMLEG